MGNCTIKTEVEKKKERKTFRVCSKINEFYMYFVVRVKE